MSLVVLHRLHLHLRRRMGRTIHLQAMDYTSGPTYLHRGRRMGRTLHLQPIRRMNHTTIHLPPPQRHF